VSAPAATPVRLERTLHDFGSPATNENWRRNLDSSERSATVSNFRGSERLRLSPFGAYVTVASPTRSPQARSAS
jgi:hypothetical protein